MNFIDANDWILHCNFFSKLLIIMIALFMSHPLGLDKGYSTNHDLRIGSIHTILE